jgi:phosphatidylserine synthase
MNKVWIIILGVLDILVFCLLAGWYFTAYDLHVGGTERAFTWGLPEPIAAILALICGILAMKRNSWRLGVIGLAIAVAAFIYICTLLWLYYTAIQ